MKSKVVKEMLRDKLVPEAIHLAENKIAIYHNKKPSEYDANLKIRLWSESLDDNIKKLKEQIYRIEKSESLSEKARIAESFIAIGEMVGTLYEVIFGLSYERATENVVEKIKREYEKAKENLELIDGLETGD